MNTAATAAPPARKQQKTTTKQRHHRLTLDTMSQALRGMEYAVRGKVVVEADKISQTIANAKNNQHGYPFEKIVYTNIGNPQSVGQQPLTWPRQVLALVDLPAEHGIEHAHATSLFPEDAIARATEIKNGIPGGTGAYSHSQGVHCLREDVADFINRRDGVDYADPDHIFLTNGASGGIQYILTALIDNSNGGKPCGVMVPTPQYPIYSATIDLLSGHQVGYGLDEEHGWSLNIGELERAYQHAVTVDHIEVNSFVLINPGNPTGQVLTKENVQDVVRFCVRHNLVLLADEVYQENVYSESSTFYSAKKAAYDLNLLHDIELVSFHSISKGVFGECGRRGGYMELTNIDEKVKDQLYKLASSSLCSTLSGQIMTALMCRGPSTNDVSYASHENEKRAIFESLQRKSAIVSDGLNAIPGFSCQHAAGSMYCFPKITNLPIDNILSSLESNDENVDIDTLYCISLLQSTGICVVPASGFYGNDNANENDGDDNTKDERRRNGFRTTFLCSEEEMKDCVEKIATHHATFVARYNSST